MAIKTLTIDFTKDFSQIFLFHVHRIEIQNTHKLTKLSKITKIIIQYEILKIYENIYSHILEQTLLFER